MKFKGKVLGLLVMLALIFGFISMYTTTYAATASNPLILGLEPFRKPAIDGNSYSYMAAGKIMWKISSYNSMDSSVADKTRTIYCLKGGPGFGSTSEMGSGSTTKERYTVYFDMKDENFINSSTIYRNVLPTGNNYNSLLWVLEHCYVPNAENANTYKNELLNAAGIPNDRLEDDEIDIAQQFAIWYFTNNDEYHQETINIYMSKYNQLVTTSSPSMDDVYPNANIIENVNKLLNYLITTAKANASTRPVSTKISLEKNNVTVEESGSNYIVGPYKLNKTGNDTNFTVNASLKLNGADISYTILDSNKSETTSTLKDLIGENFYLSIPKTENLTGKTLNFEVSGNTYNTGITFWSVEGAGREHQPVAEVTRGNEPYSLPATIDIEKDDKVFDLSLRKFITKKNNKDYIDNNGKFIKEPIVDVTPLKNGETTANYAHTKGPVSVAVGDEVVYTIRVYNEGEIDGYVTKITDHLPEQLEFIIGDELNASYGWKLTDATGRTVETDVTSPNTENSANSDELYGDRENKTLLSKFNGKELDYIDVKIKCKVKSVENLDKVITNIADITGFTDSEGNTVTDRDSQASNVILPTTSQEWSDYKGNSSNKSVLNDKDYYYKGQQDDDDFDKLILQEFDLALRKFITGVNDKPVTTRIPRFTTAKDANGNYVYEHTKEPVEVESTDIVEYTIRIFNEGDIAGYAKQIKDDIPEGLEFLPDNELNKEYRWVMLDKDGNETTKVDEAKYIVTDYLSKEQGDEKGRDNLITAFDANSMASPNYKDVKAAFKVIAPNTHPGIITNIAQISDDSDENGREIDDKDSEPNNDNMKEDDIDVEHIKLKYFDLALRKFITAVNDTDITNRYPVFKITDEGKYIYEHTKEPVDVQNGNVVTYTLRIYNEGTKSGYAQIVKDDVPEGLVFLPDNELNKEYRWVMLDKDGNETEDATKAAYIKTDYLSKEQGEEKGRDNLLLAFDKQSMNEPDHRDIKIAFKVTEPNTSSRIIINQAQISDDADEDGNEVTDIDSTPDKWIEGEDDQDIEKIKVKYFDLALRKWVTEAIVIENGKEKITQTGHKAEDDPEEIVKVELVESKINKVVVKFRYKIRITNEGEIAGYATEISDYIPEGLKFVQADNPKWKEVDGKIVTDQLKDTLLQPGDSTEVEVLLTWINGKNNLNLKINVAEISKDKNDSNTPDIDSTPNNKKPGEDDIDDAPVILSVKTGESVPVEYIATIGGATILLASGAVLIKKYVLI